MKARNSESSTEHLEPDAVDMVAVRDFQLDVIEGPDCGAHWETDDISERCTIGSHPSCDLVLRDPTVSRFHVRLIRGPQQVQIRDLDSRNGTFVDGVRINDAYIKPGTLLKLGRTAIKVTIKQQLAQLPLSSRSQFGLLVGTSLVMRRLFTFLERAAQSTATILLQGETGCGKSAAARSVHLESTRKNRPFVMLDCGSLPANLLEAELFGHERGAFTSAHKTRIGAFEEADTGTIFLDELGELPLELQAKLLSVVENREVRRIGSNRTRSVDVRMIAATNRDLRSEVNARRFREDLYYRLAVLDVEVPPLRQRLSDLPTLIESLLAHMDVTREQIASIATPELLARLQGSVWPGNIRELRNFLERHLLFRDLEELATDVVLAQDPPQPEDQSGSQIDLSVPFSEARRRAVDGFERRYVEQLLNAHDGHVARAAASAGITRTYLYRVLQRHKMSGKSI